jgi:molybdenum cofactor biosynthesis enzyme MoaA
LPWPIVRNLLHDCVDVGIWDVRFYGGEPLLHKDLAKMVGLSTSLDLQCHVTTNGILLGRRIEELYDAGLRNITIGFYGTDEGYNTYVQRKDRFAELESSAERVRQRYGDSVNMRINWLLMRPSCSVDALHSAVEFADRFGMTMQVDLIHYSLPYFSEGPDRVLQFRPEDRPAIETVRDELVRLKTERPTLINQSVEGLRSIPDWLIKGPDMRVPCDSHQMLWVGADGTVQQCYVTFRLGNLHENRLPELLFTEAHRKAARGSFDLTCPNCHCHYDQRIRKHRPSAHHYRNGTS